MEPLRILLADDDPAVYYTGFKLIENAVKSDYPDADIRKCRCGEECLELIAEGYIPDIAVLDHKMGEVSGLSVAEVIKQKDRKARFILVTGTSNSFVEIKTKQLEGELFEKPCEYMRIVDYILECF